MRIRGLSALTALVLFLVAFVAAPAWAQQTGDIEGTVVDSGNAPLPGVSVEIKSASLQGTRVAVTDGSGRYRFPAVPPGSYTVTANLSGFAKQEKAARVSLGSTASVAFTLQLAGVKEEVVVTGEAPVVDTTKNVVGTATTIETIQKLPLARNYTSIATTVAGTGTSAGGGVTVYGATGLENQYIIDGVNTTGIKIGDQGKTLNQEFVQEVEVKTGGYEAEYSRALGGIINVVTKSGGNEFHGDVFGYYDNKSLAASDKRVDDRAAVQSGELNIPKRLDIGLDLGGYFVKDRIWFFGAYDRVNRDTDNNVATSINYSDPNLPTTFKTQTDTDRDNLFSAKLTFRLGESHTVAVSAFGDPGEHDGEMLNSAGLIGSDSARNGLTKTGGTDFSAKWDGLFGTSLLGQLQYGYHSQKSEDQPYGTGPAIAERRRGLLTFIDGSGPFLPWNEKYTRHMIKLAGTGFLGSHELKLGGDYEIIDSNFQEAYGAYNANFYVRRSLSSGGSYLYSRQRYFSTYPLNCVGRIDADGNVIPGNFGQPGPGNALVPDIYSCAGYTASPNGVVNTPKTRNGGVFLQDSWKVLKNLTVNAGVRYDIQRLKDAEGETKIALDNEWSPRVGIVWDFLNNGKSKFFANYGRYYTVIPQDIQTRALGNEYFTQAFNYNPNPDPLGDAAFGYAYVQGGEITDANLKGMYTDEVIGGVEYEVFKNWSLGIKGIYKGLGRVVEDRCDVYDPRVNLAQYVPAGSLASCALTNMGDGGSALSHLADPSNPACVSGYDADGNPILTGPCESIHPRRYYRGMEIDVTHRFADNFYFLASYVYSKLEGNYDGNEKQSTGQQDPNINADFDYIDLYPNNFGRLSLDRQHQVKLTGTYSFPFGLTAGASFRYASGAPFQIHGFANPSYPAEKYLIAGRGEMGDLPAQYEMDLHLEYNARIGAVTITPVVDVFNLMNRQGVTSRDGLFNSLDVPSNDPANQIGNPDYPNCTAATANYGNTACSTNPNYLKDTNWQDPLKVRIGARISF